MTVEYPSKYDGEFGDAIKRDHIYTSEGSVYKSLSNALSGDPEYVFLGPGTFNVNGLSVPSNTAIQGSGKDQTTIDGESNNPGLDVNNPKVTISNLNINGKSNPLRIRSDYILVDSCKFTGGSGTGYILAFDDGDASNVQVSNCSFLSGQKGIFHQQNSDLFGFSLINCLFEDQSSHCIQLRNATSNGGDVRELSISGIVMRGVNETPEGLALRADGATNTSGVVSNVVGDGLKRGILTNDAGGQINNISFSNIHIRNTSNDGITLQNAQSCSLNGFTVKGASGNGVVLQDAGTQPSRNKIVDGLIENSGDRGFVDEGDQTETRGVDVFGSTNADYDFSSATNQQSILRDTNFDPNSIDHNNQLTNINSDDHHTKYTDEEAQDAVGNNFSTGLSYDDATAAYTLDESVLKDGSSKELDVADLAAGLGTSGQVIQTDGSAASWVTLSASDISDVSADSVSDAHHTKTPSFSRVDVTSQSTTLSAWDSAWVDTASAGGAVTVTLPDQPSDGDRVEVGVNDASNDTTVTSNTNDTILNGDQTLTTLSETVTLEYNASSNSWMVR